MQFYSLFQIGLISLFWISSSFALEPIQVQVDQRIPHGNHELGVGSRLTLKIPVRSNARLVNGIFLGKIVEPNGGSHQFMFLDETHSKVYFAPKEKVEIGKYSFQRVLRPYEQVGETCTGYAIDHYFQQMYWSGLEGSGALKTELSTEKGRTQLLVDAVNEYYLVLQHRYSLVGVMNKFGKRFGFKCKVKQFPDSEGAISYLQAQLSDGLPVMISFLLGPNMVKSPVSFHEYGKPGELDGRLWIPRKKGERESGGHSVVATSLFEFKGRPFLLMLDSDWSEPRLWDVRSYLDSKTAMDEVEFITCI